MNEKLAELATQAGLGVIRNKGWHPLPIGSKHIEHFAQLVRQNEREACAKLCEDLQLTDLAIRDWADGTYDCAIAIRAKGNHEQN
jgi:hypothetical protein